MQKGEMKLKNEVSMCRQFCCYYAKLGNIREAAIKAGFPPESALSEGMKILGRKRNRETVQKLMADHVPVSELVRTGLERIAFGSANDAAFLVFSEEIPDPAAIAGLDLFNVSEIKKIKGGGVEVRLFDRQKALERLYEYASQENTQSAENLINALNNMEAADGDEV
ncbi:MAG: terminase small subunit [Porcipelethomonas sp.]